MQRTLHHILFFFFFNDTATTEIYTLSLHDALPISLRGARGDGRGPAARRDAERGCRALRHGERSEEHTSELQSRSDLVCRLLLEKKKRHSNYPSILTRAVRSCIPPKLAVAVRDTDA